MDERDGNFLGDENDLGQLGKGLELPDDDEEVPESGISETEEDEE